MTDSLLEKISVSNNNPYITDRWLFDSYYDYKEKQYKSVHENEPDAWTRNLYLEFASKIHISEENLLIKQSEAIFAFLTESDNQGTQQIASNYLRYARALYGLRKSNIVGFA